MTVAATRRAAGALFLGCLLAAAPASAASLDKTICKPPVTGKGTAVHQSDAKQLARSMWLAKVSSHYGGQYANLAKAKVLTDQCQSLTKAAHCVFEARPCKVVKVQLSPQARKPITVAPPARLRPAARGPAATRQPSGLRPSRRPLRRPPARLRLRPR